MENSNVVKISSKIVSVKVLDNVPTRVETIIPENVSLPADAPARMKTLKSEGRKWYLTVVYHPNTEQPFALFCHTNHYEKTTQTSTAVERLCALAERKGIPTKFIESVHEKAKHDPNTSKLTRSISLLLRHGVLVENIVAELDAMDDIYVGSFLFQIKKFLSNHIEDGTVADGHNCPVCDTPQIFSEGCLRCPSCGHSKCG